MKTTPPEHEPTCPSGAATRDTPAGTGDRSMQPRELWSALLRGHWSMIDRYDEDGRRYYVARRNDEASVPKRSLTHVEAQIVTRAGAGEPNKVIAYELGLAYSTVAAYLSRACRKMGLEGRLELIQLARALDLDLVEQVTRSPTALAS